METLDIHSRLYMAFAVSFGLIVIGTWNALVPSSRLAHILSHLLGITSATTIAWLFEPAHTLIVAGLVAAVSLLWQLATSNFILEVMRYVRVRWALFATASVIFAGWEVYRFDRIQHDEDTAAMSAMLAETFATPLTEDLLGEVFTDTGATIPAIRPIQCRSMEEMNAMENDFLSRSPHREQVIKRGPASEQFNCHGWVFTGGRFGIHGKDVERILQDNRYEKTMNPIPGDICVYRDDNDTVSHTALVRAVCDDGTILVEGKWGWMGMYLHPAGKSCYGENYRFYHTVRAGHLLMGTIPSMKKAMIARTG